MSEKNKVQLSLVQKDTVDVVANRVRQFQESGELHFPANYSPENAMKAAWLAIQETVDRNKKPAIEVCTRNSIANALLGMVIQGLNPAKQQCYFIVYGNKLTLQRSYFGTMHVAKTVDPNIKDIFADVVYEKDIFEYKKMLGRTVVMSHEQKLSNINKDEIIAAYCVVLYKDDSQNTTIMTLDEIKKAWSMSKMNPLTEKGNLKPGSTHGEHTAEMCKKTVTNRACKTIINSSSDSSLVLKAARTTEADFAEAEAYEEIETNANTINVSLPESAADESREIDFDEETGEVMDGAEAQTSFSDLP